jgi:hypothetical protein
MMITGRLAFAGSFVGGLVALAVASTPIGCGGESKERPPAGRAAVRPVAVPAEDSTVGVVDDDDRGPAPTAGAARDKVTIKLSVDAHWKAHVFWGRKDLGVAPLQIDRPRGSGPLDLLIVADGALPLHTRVFTDRDNGLSVRLYAESEAPGLLGYPRSFSLPTSTRLTHNAGTFPRPRR